MHHEPPSERVRALMRLGAELALNAPPEWLEEVDDATLSPGIMRAIAEDPNLAASMRRANRANLLHWANANVADPGAPVAPNLGAEALYVARDLVRRGVRETALHAFRTGQNAAWLRWMAICFQLTSDPAELRELLDVSARSIHGFLDATIAGLAAHMDATRDALARGTPAERREVVALLLDGAPMPVALASERLGYPLGGPHQAAIVWSEAARADLAALEAVAEALTIAGPLLVVVASAGTLWAWSPEASPLDELRAAAARAPGVRVALGTAGHGVEGFRRSHLDALATQRLLAHLGADARVASFDMVRLVALATQDLEAADAFVHHTLGALATAGPDLQANLLVFLEEGCNAVRAAARLRTHRNTLLRRLARAEELLPRPLEHHRVQVAAALEVLRWRRPG